MGGAALWEECAWSVAFCCITRSISFPPALALAFGVRGVVEMCLHSDIVSECSAVAISTCMRSWVEVAVRRPRYASLLRRPRRFGEGAHRVWDAEIERPTTVALIYVGVVFVRLLLRCQCASGCGVGLRAAGPACAPFLRDD